MLKLLTLYFILYLLRQTVKLHDIGHGYREKCRMGRIMPSFPASISFSTSVRGGYYPRCLQSSIFPGDIFPVFNCCYCLGYLSFLLGFKIFSLSLMFCKSVIYCLICLIVFISLRYLCMFEMGYLNQTHFE